MRSSTYTSFLLLLLTVFLSSESYADPYANNSPPPPPPTTGVAAPPPDAVAGKEFPQSVTCNDPLSKCFGKILSCPKQCPKFKSSDSNKKSCFIDCNSKNCEAVCKSMQLSLSLKYLYICLFLSLSLSMYHLLVWTGSLNRQSRPCLCCRVCIHICVYVRMYLCVLGLLLQREFCAANPVQL